MVKSDRRGILRERVKEFAFCDRPHEVGRPSPARIGTEAPMTCTGGFALTVGPGELLFRSLRQAVHGYDASVRRKYGN